MMRKCGCCAAVFLFSAAGACFGWEPPAADKPEKPASRVARPARLGAAGRQLDTITKELNLDAEQAAAVAKLLDAHRDKMRNISASFRRSPEEIEEMKAIREQMREAREAGDREAMDALLASLREIRRARQEKMAPAKEQMEAAKQALHDGISELLREDQQPKFEKLWKQRFFQEGRRRGPVRNPRALLALVNRLDDLKPEQKKQVEDLFRQFRESQKRNRENPSPQAKKKNQAKLFNDVLAVLTPVQRQKIERQLRGRGGRTTKRDGRKSPGRFRRPGNDTQGEDAPKNDGNPG